MTIRPPTTSRMFTSMLLSGAMAFAIQSVGCVDIGAPTGCLDESDCRNGRFCIEGQCVTFELYDENSTANNTTVSNNTTPVNTSTPVNSTTPPPIQIPCEDQPEGCSECLELEPGSIDFGIVPLETRRVEQLKLRNCSEDRPLGIYDFGIDAEGDFKITAWSISEPPFQIPPGDNAFIEVELEPTYEGEHFGVLGITSSASNEGFAELFGQVVLAPDDNTCPTARGTAFAVNEARGPEKTLDNIRPGLIMLNGDGSTDRDGTVTRWEWALERIPSGSEAVLGPSEGPNAEIVVDAPGRYELLLRVYDDFGVESCEPAQVFINVCENCDQEP